MTFLAAVPICSYREQNSEYAVFEAFGRISRERFKRGSRIFTALSGTISRTNMSDMKSLAAFGRLQNATE